MTDRELMQMALDLIEPLAGRTAEVAQKVEDAKKALRDRLAKPDREWVGLTDEEILSDDTMRYYYGLNGGAGPVSQKGKKVISAIEAKLKEKNCG